MDNSELERMLEHVVRGPAADDCWLWVGAIADDGYGRFAIRRDGREKMVRPHRHLFEHVMGVELTTDQPLMHGCDIPICVHVELGELSHLEVGTHRVNMRDREQKGRAGRRGLYRRGLSRAQLAARSRALRSVILERGWDREAIAAALADVSIEHPRLF